jgi:hypothetical protein
MEWSAAAQRFYEEMLADGFVEEFARAWAEVYEKGYRIGFVDGVRRLRLSAGTQRFGAPSPSIMAALTSLAEWEELAGLGSRLREVSSWEELLCAACHSIDEFR